VFLIFHTHYPTNLPVNTTYYKAPQCTVSPTLLSLHVPTSELTSVPCYPTPSKWVIFGALTAMLLSVAIFWATISHWLTHRPNPVLPTLYLQLPLQPCIFCYPEGGDKFPVKFR